jgi:hypothetical protein
VSPSDLASDGRSPDDATSSAVAASEVDPSSRARGRRRGNRRRPPRWPILLVVVGAVVAAGVYQNRDTSTASSSSATRSAAAFASVGVPPSDAVSTSWFCAEGTSNDGGRADETILVGNVSTTEVKATITVMPGGDGKPVSREISVAPGDEEQVKVASILATPEPGVVVEVVGGRAVVSHSIEHDGDFAVEPCSRTTSTSWYFAAGTTVKGSQHFLVLFNPFGDDAIADVRFLTDTGVQQPDDVQGLVIPRRSRVSIAVHDLVPRQERVAAEVHLRAGRVVAERDQIFDGTPPDTGPTRQGIALSLGATSPAREWVIPAGSSANGATNTVAVANYSVLDTEAEVAVLLPDGQTANPQSVQIPSRQVVSVDFTNRVPADSPYSLVVRSRSAEGDTEPVVAESLSWWPASSSSTGVASTLGPPRAAMRWVVLLPDVDADALLSVANVGTKPVTASLLPADQVDRKVGPTSEPERAVAPNSVASFTVANLRTNHGVLVITAEHPISVGLTVLGAAGASTSAAFPDYKYTGPSTSP